MHLLPISLLAILAGTLLLAKFKKEAAGKLFAVISWFFIVVGFILFIGFIGGSICRMSHYECMGKAGCGHEMMMKDCRMGMQGQYGMMGMNKEMNCCCCCAGGMDKGMCSKMKGCMMQDSTMKDCTMHMEADSAKK